MRKLTCKNGNIVYVGTQEEVRTIHHAMYRAWLKDKIQITPTGYFTYERIRIEGFNLIQGILLDKREGYFDPILLKLYEKSEGNLEKTQQGIIYIDEIDKLALRGENTSLTRDVSGEGVQQALLKILEGTIARVPLGGGRKHPNAECVNIDTSNILFICGGAFDGLEKLINQDKKVNRTIGFGVSTENVSNEEEFTLENVQQHDLVRYGMMPEFIGRLPVITTLAPLTENDMVRILTEPKNAIVRQFQELFAMDDVKLQFEKDALMKIAAIANEKRIGARGLRSIVENVLQKTMFELPDIKSANYVSIKNTTNSSVNYSKNNKRYCKMNIFVSIVIRQILHLRDYL